MKTVMIQSETNLQTSIMWDVKKIFCGSTVKFNRRVFLTDANMIKWEAESNKKLISCNYIYMT